MTPLCDLTRELEADLVAALGLEPTPLPRDLAHASGTHREEPAHIETRAYHGPGVRLARVATLWGGGLDIGNLLVLPTFDHDFPIFGADFVSLSGDAVMAAVDLSPLGPVPPELAALHHRVTAELPGGGPLPAWAEAHFSPYPLYTRAPPRAIPAIAAATRAYAHTFERLTAVPPLPGADTSASQLAYLRAHREGDRGLEILGRLFGAGWTQRYLEGILFPLDARGSS